MVFPILLLAMLLASFAAIALYMLFHPSFCEKHGIRMEWRLTAKKIVSPFAVAANDLSPNSPYDMKLYCPECEKEAAHASV